MTKQQGAGMPDVIKFLLGEGQLDGCRYGEFPDNGEKYKRRYWWRKALREAWNIRADQTAPAAEIEGLDEAINRAEVGMCKDGDKLLLIQAARAYASQSRADQWQPIETLPEPENRPGRYWAKFTGWEEHSGRLWNREHSAVVYSHPLEPFGVSPDDLELVMKQGSFDGIDAITHWMPLAALGRIRGEG